MEEKALVLVEKLGAVIAQSGGVMVDEYTRWHFIASIAWFVGACLVFALMAQAKLGKDSDIEPGAFFVLKVIVCSVAVLVALGNVPGLFAPKAEGIHQLIKDIRGAK